MDFPTHKAPITTHCQNCGKEYNPRSVEKDLDMKIVWKYSYCSEMCFIEHAQSKKG